MRSKTSLIQVYKKNIHGNFLQMQADVAEIWKDEIDNGKDEKLFHNKIVELIIKTEGRENSKSFMKKAQKKIITPKEAPEHDVNTRGGSRL